MSAAFVVLAHADPPALSALLKTLDPFPTAIHIDKTAERDGLFHHVAELGMPNVVVNPRPRCVHWGGYSMVRAMFETLSLALDEFPSQEMFVFLSGQCFPLKPVDQFVEYLGSTTYSVHCRAFDLSTAVDPVRGLERVTRSYFFDGPIGHIRSVSPKVGRPLRWAASSVASRVPKKLDDRIHACGSQWTALPRDLAQELVTSYRQGYFDYLTNAFAPDELAVPTYVYNSNWAANTVIGGLETRPPGRHIGGLANFHWLREDRSVRVTSEDVISALASTKYFIRKVPAVPRSEARQLLEDNLKAAR